MKFICSMALLIFSMTALAQKKITYYDYNWKPCESLKARFYSTLEKTDSGWLRYDYFISGPKLQMKALFEDSACKIYNGQYILFHANGNVASMGRKLHNKEEGVCMRYHSNTMMADSATYHNGERVGTELGWYPNGFMSDSSSRVNDSMEVELSWFDNGGISSVGYYLHDKMHGKWNFFHRNGKPSGVELYDHGKVVAKQFFNEDGSPLADTSKATAKAVFKGGINQWQQYLNENLYWPQGYHFSKGDMAVVVLQLTINEEGKPENVEVVTPFHPVFDKLALEVIRKSPAWQPTVSHNRKVKSSFRQPVTFKEEEQ